MSLANLNINVTANVAPVVNAMAGVQVATAQSMTKSGVSVSEFQRSFTQSADVVRDRSAGINSDMSAMNNGIAQGAQDASKAIDGITQAAKSVQVGNIGKQVNQQMQAIEEGKTKFQEFEQDAKSWAARTATFAGLAFVTGVSAAVFTGLYAAYKSLDFVGGLFTGESYKSKSIDAVIASNKEVQSLQSSLQLAAVDANALNDAMGRLNVDKADYSSVYEKTESAIRSNGDELDRLGIQHKNANGQFLETYQILENSRKKLDEYTDGWDRNQAAAAIGMGSYAQINNYLKLNQQELDNSKARLNDYNLGLGTEGQAHLAAYQKAMREFNNELKLMGDGFKRAWSDQILPAATATATFLKDGWPIAVNAFRYATAQITSLLYGLKMAFDVVTDVIVGDVKAQYQVFSSIYEASQKALTGDFGGAKELLVKGWTDAKNTVSKIGSDIVADANKNSAAMKLAWGFDNRSGGSGNGMPGSGKNKGKAWNPAAATEEENSKAASAKDDSRLWQIAHDKYLEYLKAFSAKEAEIVKTSAQEQLEANQDAWDWGLISQQQYLAKKWALSVNAAAAEVQLKKEELARYNAEVSKGYVEGDARSSAEYHENLKKQAVAEKDLINLDSKLAITRMQNSNAYNKGLFDQNQKLKELHATQLQVNNDHLSAAQLQQQMTELTPAFLQMSIEAQEAQKTIWAEQNKSLTDSNSVMSGMKAGLNDYAKAAQDVGSQVKSFTSDMMKGMEDALVNFVKTGKLSFKDMANSIISDLIRIAIQKSITGPLASAIGSGIGSLFGQANGGAWSNGVQMFANGGVFSGATAFGMAGGGIGILGEAGPEAVMPLSRTSNGRLGVDVVSGLKGATSPNVVINIENKSSGEVKQGSTNMQFDGKGFVISTIIEDVQNNGPLRGLMAGAGGY